MNNLEDKKIIEVNENNKSLVENFIRRLGNSNMLKITIAAKGDFNTPEGVYEKRMNAIKGLPEYNVILEGKIEEGLESDIRYFANVSSENMSKMYPEIFSRASKYNGKELA